MLLPSRVPEPEMATEMASSSLEPEEAVLPLVKAQVGWVVLGFCGALVGFF